MSGLRSIEPLAYISRASDLSESPIEVMFLGGLRAVCRERRRSLTINGDLDVDGADGHVSARTQFEIAGYRLDFLITNAYAAIAVECDGWQYHEGAGIDKAVADRRRDRVLLAKHAWVTVRFLGRELNDDARQCAREALDVLDTFAERLGAS